MNADEVILSERPKADETTRKGVSSAPLYPEPISETELAELEAKYPVVHQGRLRIYGDLKGIADVEDIPIRVCARCERFDLSEAADRSKYAALKNEAEAADATIQISWEEHVKDGLSMVIYLTYFEYFRVVQK